MIADLLLDANQAREAAELYTLNRVSATTKAAGYRVRLDETNSFDHGGQAGVLNAGCTAAQQSALVPGCVYASQTYASALWALDWIFQVANQGYAGINFQIHGDYTPFDFYQNGTGYLTQPAVAPLYYGMAMAAEALHGRAVLLQLKDDPVRSCAAAADAPACFKTAQALRVWAVLDAGSGELRFVVINKAAQAHSIQLKLPSAGRLGAVASVERLEAPQTATAGTEKCADHLGCHAGWADLTSPPTADRSAPTWSNVCIRHRLAMWCRWTATARR